MAIPFNLPDEQSDPENLLHRRLTDLYHLLYQILVNRDAETSLQTIAPEDLSSVPANGLNACTLRSPSRPCSPTLAATTELEAFFLPASGDSATFRARPLLAAGTEPYYGEDRKKVGRHFRKTIQHKPPPRPYNPDWKEVGCNLRQIADNFLHNNAPETVEEEPEEYDTGGGGDLLTTIVAMSPFRDSIWSAVFVVGCRLLANVR